MTKKRTIDPAATATWLTILAGSTFFAFVVLDWIIELIQWIGK